MKSSQSEGEPVDLSSLPIELILPVIVKNWRFIALCTLAAMIALYGALLYFSPVYEVSANVLLKLGREMAPPSTANSAQFVSAKRAEDVESEIEIMSSPYLVQELVHELGTDFFTREDQPVTRMQRLKAGFRHALTDLKSGVHELMIHAGLARRVSISDMIIASLSKNLSAEQVPKSDVIGITLRTPDPASGVIILNKFVELYLKQHIAVYKSPQARTFFESESSDLQKELAQANANWRKIREKREVWDIAEQRQLLLHARGDLEAKYAATTDSLHRLGDEIAQLEKQRTTLPAQVEVTSTSERNPTVKSLDDHILDLQAKRAQMLTVFTPESQTIKDIDDEINKFRAMRQGQPEFITSSVTRAPNDAIASIAKIVVEKRAEQQGLTAEAAEEERQIADLTSRLQGLDQSQSDVEAWDREIGILNKDYLLYKDKLEDARISEAMDLANISNAAVVAPASASSQPVWPNKRMWAFAALFLGLFGSAGFALLRELLKPTARSRSEITRILNVPVLGSVREWRFHSRHSNDGSRPEFARVSHATNSQGA